MEEKKSIKVSIRNWDLLTSRKNKLRLKTIDEVISVYHKLIKKLSLYEDLKKEVEDGHISN